MSDASLLRGAAPRGLVQAPPSLREMMSESLSRPGARLRARQPSHCR
eukprot:CAMPEP_0185415476 /NCGR_PEP_ID=MMETSP1365-20130426/6535_1 /TAXON_ID=38817 /ORGANISM="Gephyrocapsa oceanica, Strain RCC1303" /LENGTH=46 /DNA_ID= /DNA_START= /DNA_END= /DNA_ORIENTATION=